jgi:leucyl aminopeptidase
MKFQAITGAALERSADLLVLNVFSDARDDSTFKAADKKLQGLLSELADAESFEGKARQSLSTPTAGKLPAKRITVLGLGSKDDFTIGELRNLAARAVKQARRVGAKKIAFALPTLAAGDLELATQMSTEGAILGDYKFLKYKKKEAKKRKALSSFAVVAAKAGGKKMPSAAKLRAAAKRGEAVATATCAARDFINEPAAAMNPSRMASEARKLARKYDSLSTKVLSAKECEKLGMGMFLAVGRGSAQPPKLVHITYKPKKKAKKVVALIGKGVTFDSGGYSIKPSSSMEDMKIDMSGSAAVVAAMGAIAELGSPYEVHAVTALCENMVDADAYRLGDVLTALDGTTVEINNTDAEGRLTLGDAIGYTRAKVKPDEMFDFATLTGACVVALGPHTAGVMSDHEELVQSWLAAAEGASEHMWRLPLTPRLKDQLKSNIADMRNTGERWGGALTAGLFLKHFVKDTPWVHVDIAGPASANREHGATVRGGAGFAVATIVEYLTR